MANTTRVEITATYGDKASPGIAGTERMIRNLKAEVLALAGAWGIREVAQFTLEISKLAATSQMAEMSFGRIVSGAGRDFNSTMDQMRKAVSGTLSDMVLMQKVGAAVDAGLTFDQAITALEFLRRYSLAFGKDFNQLMQTIFTGLQRGSVMFLDDAGIILSAQDAMFEGMGDLEKKTALVNRAVEMMAEKMQMLPEPMDNVITASARLANEWERLRIEAGKWTEGPMAKIMAAMTRDMQELRGAEPATGPITGMVQGAKNILGLPQLLRDLKINIDALPPSLQSAASAMDLWVTSNYDAIAVADKHKEAQKEFENHLNMTILLNDKAIAQMRQRIDAEEEQARAVQKNRDETARLNEELQKKAAFDRQLEMERWRAKIIQAPAVPLPVSAENESAALDNYERFLNEIAKMEVQASGDRQQIIAFEFEQRKTELLKWAIDVKASAAEITKLMQALEATRKQSAEEAKKQAEIRHILLFFDADTSNVRDASDLAAYSIGLLTEQLRGLDPALASAINGIQQIVVGAKARGFGGTAGIIAGGLGILGSVIGAFQRKSAEAEAEMRRLAQALDAAREAGGAFAQQLEGQTEAELKSQFGAITREIRYTIGTGQIFGDLENFFIDVDQTMQEIYRLHGGGTKYKQAQVLIMEAQRIEEALGHFRGAVYTFGDVMDLFQHTIRVQDLQDPTAQLALLQRQLAEAGINAAGLPLRDQWRLEETIADLERQKAQVEIDAREEQAKTVIESIHRQQTDVQRALDDALAAQQQAVLRSVRLRFDVQEIALRQQFMPRLIGAGGDTAETARIVGELSREIEVLRLAEAAAGTAELAKLRESYDAAQAQNERATELMVQAVEAAAQHTGTDFREAIYQQTDLMLAGWDTALSKSVLGDPISPAELIDLRQSVLIDMSALLQPVGVRPVDLALALEPYGVSMVDIQTALSLQGVRSVDLAAALQPVGVRLIDLAVALEPYGVSPVDLQAALALQGVQVVDLAAALQPVGVRPVQLYQALELQGVKEIELYRALELQGIKVVSLSDVLTPVGVRLVDLAQALDLTGQQVVDMTDALALQGVRVVDMQEYLNPVGVRLVDLSQALGLTGQQTVDLAAALDLQGVQLVNLATALSPVGIRLVDLSQALGLTGQQTVDLVNALRVQGQLIVSAETALALRGTVAVQMQDALSLTGQQTVNLAGALKPVGTIDVDLAQAVKLTGSLDIPAEFRAIAGNLDLVNMNAFLTQRYTQGVQSAVEAQTNILHNDLTSIAASLEWTRLNTYRTANLVEGLFRMDFTKFVLERGSFFVEQLAGSLGAAGALQLPGFQHGGFTDWPISEGRPVILHGQEEVIPAGGRSSRKEITVHLDMPLTITMQGGSAQSRNEARQVYEEIETRIEDSLRDGRLRRVVREVTR